MKKNMWAVSPIPPAPFLCRPTTQHLRPFLSTQSRSAPPKNDGVYGEEIRGLGHTVLSNLNSGNSSARKRQKQTQEDGKQLSGSDVLWALQRAAAVKKKKNKKKKEASSADTHREYDDVVDYSNVKPLCIKSEWAVKLDELEKRLQEISEFI